MTFTADPAPSQRTPDAPRRPDAAPAPTAGGVL